MVIQSNSRSRGPGFDSRPSAVLCYWTKQLSSTQTGKMRTSFARELHAIDQYLVHARSSTLIVYATETGVKHGPGRPSTPGEYLNCEPLPGADPGIFAAGRSEILTDLFIPLICIIHYLSGAPPCLARNVHKNSENLSVLRCNLVQYFLQ